MKKTRPTFKDFKDKVLQNPEVKVEYEAIENKIVTAQQLIDFGMPRAIFWNNDLSKKVPSDIFIVSTLQRAYNDFVIDKFIEFFGKDFILAVLEKHREKLSDQLFDNIIEIVELRFL